MKYSLNSHVFKMKKQLFFSFIIVSFSFINGASAQNWPIKPVKIVVPFPAGGAVDTVARTLGQQVSESLKQPFLIENKPGANGILGAEALAKSAPDGYTLMITSAGFCGGPQHVQKAALRH